MVNVVKSFQLQKETIMVFNFGEESGKLAWKWVGGEDSSGACLPALLLG